MAMILMSNREVVLDLTPTWWNAHGAPAWAASGFRLFGALCVLAQEDLHRQTIGLFSALDPGLEGVRATLQVPADWTDDEVERRRLALASAIEARP